MVVVDHEMSDDSGLDLLDALERLRSLRGVTVLLNSRQPLSDEEMQRLRRYSAMTLSKEEDVERMGALIRPEPAAASKPGRLATGGVRRAACAAGGRGCAADLFADSPARRAGLPVVPATSADEAVERFEEDAFDLVLLDMSQPGAEGPELAQDSNRTMTAVRRS